MKNPKKIFRGFFKRRKPQKGGLGVATPTRFPQDKIERLAKFGTVVESCSKKVTLSAASTNTTIPAGRFGFSGFTNKAIAAAVSARFLLTRHRKSGFLPAVSLHGEEKLLPMLRRVFFSLIPTNQQKAEWTEISKFLSYFPFSWGNTGALQKCQTEPDFFWSALHR